MPVASSFQRTAESAWSFGILPREAWGWDRQWSGRLRSITALDLAVIHGQWMREAAMLLPKIDRGLGAESALAVQQVSGLSFAATEIFNRDGPPAEMIDAEP